MPTTSPRLLILLAPFSAPPRLPRSWTEPSLSHNTACAAVLLLTANGGRPVVEHKPELQTVWPRSLIVNAYATVSPFDTSGESTDRKSTRLNSSHLVISYAVFCLKKRQL